MERGKSIFTIFDFLIGRYGLISFERRNAEIQAVYNDSDCPNIDFKMVAFTK